jgi:pilus assembly protein Flp/PilA
LNNGKKNFQVIDQERRVMDLAKELFLRVCARLLNALRCEEGQTLVEYGLLIVLIAVVVLLMLRGTGQQINQTWSTINSGISQ